jgi:hypothetical protein
MRAPVVSQTFERIAPCYPFERFKREDVVVRAPCYRAHMACIHCAHTCDKCFSIWLSCLCFRAQPGQMVRPQLSKLPSTLGALMGIMKGKECVPSHATSVAAGLHAGHRLSDVVSCTCVCCRYIAELKFDGERIQLHRDGDKARSRSTPSHASARFLLSH